MLFLNIGDWVRHIESHSEVSQNLPKKRRRLEVV
jgi:hypothetical protein